MNSWFMTNDSFSIHDSWPMLCADMEFIKKTKIELRIIK